MSRIKEWVKVKVKKFIKSRFFLFILALAIGVSFSISYYEGKTLWAEYRESIQTFERIKGLSDGAVVSAVALAETDGALSVNSERETDSTQSPLPLEEIIRRIGILESSNGINQPKYCTEKGLTNKYGYGIYGEKILCFQSDEEARREVHAWLLRQQDKGLTLPQILCRYNTGIISENCEYAKNFNSIK